MISDLDESLGSQYFPNVTNERTCFAMRARIKEGSISSLECTKTTKPKKLRIRNGIPDM